MNPVWHEFLVRQAGNRADGEDFGSPMDELTAASANVVIVPLVDQGLIGIDGPDAAPFLHALATNDVEGLGADSVRFGGLCTAKGRMFASFYVWRTDGGLVVQVAADILAALLKKLSMYILRSKVKLTDLGVGITLLGIGGPKADALVGQLAGKVPDVRQLLSMPGGHVMRLDRNRFVLALEPQAAIDLWPKAVAIARPAGSAAWRWLEIAAGQPRVVAATQEAFVPQMLNMEIADVGGLVFTKGCYPGQEVVARTQYLGKIKRRMYRVALAAPVLPGTDVFTPESAGQHCGSIVNVAPSPDGGFEALLVVQSSGAEAGEVHVGSPDGPLVRFLSLPYSVA
jgi:hypothetical protein